MIFSIDVRHTVCKKVAERTRLIELKTDLDYIRKDEIDNNQQIADKLKEAIAIIDDVIELKVEEEKEVIHKFEKDFVDDVLHDTEFYMLRLKDSE